MDISYRIQALRKSKRLTQTELGNLLGKNLRTIQKYESGEIEPPISVLEQMASVLDVSITDLLGIEPPVSCFPSFYDMVLKELDIFKGTDVASDDERLKVAGALVVLRDYLKDNNSQSQMAKNDCP